MNRILLLLLCNFLMAAAYGQTLVNDRGYLDNHANSNYPLYCEDGVLFMKGERSDYYPSSLLIKYPQSKDNSSYTVPDWVSCIAKGAFQGNKYIERIRIPSSVHYIGENAFADCTSLKSIEVYESTSGVRAMENDESHSQVNEVGRYNIQGVKIEEGKDGQVQIILYSDGTAKKVIE